MNQCRTGEVERLYKENRPIVITGTKYKLEKTKLELRSGEMNSFHCPTCLKEMLIRDQKTHLCMDCYVSKITKGRCSKCGELLIKENYTGQCINENRCGVI